MSKNSNWKGTDSSKDQIFAFLDNPGQIFGKKISNQVRLDKKKMYLFCFCMFLNCYLQSLSS